MGYPLFQLYSGRIQWDSISACRRVLKSRRLLYRFLSVAPPLLGGICIQHALAGLRAVMRPGRDAGHVRKTERPSVARRSGSYFGLVSILECHHLCITGSPLDRPQMPPLAAFSPFACYRAKRSRGIVKLGRGRYVLFLDTVWLPVERTKALFCIRWLKRCILKLCHFTREQWFLWIKYRIITV